MDRWIVDRDQVCEVAVANRRQLSAIHRGRDETRPCATATRNVKAIDAIALIPIGLIEPTVRRARVT